MFRLLENTSKTTRNTLFMLFWLNKRHTPQDALLKHSQNGTNTRLHVDICTLTLQNSYCAAGLHANFWQDPCKMCITVWQELLDECEPLLAEISCGNVCHCMPTYFTRNILSPLNILFGRIARKNAGGLEQLPQAAAG